MLLAAGGARSNTVDGAGRSVSFVETLLRPDGGHDRYTSVMEWRPDGCLGTETINADPTITYGYDPAGQLTSASSTAGFSTWVYGTRGNRVSQTINATTTTYTSNPNGSAATASTPTAETVFGYDEAGRRTSAETTTGGIVSRSLDYTWDAKGKLESLHRVDPAAGIPDVTETRAHDASGLVERSQFDTPTATVWFWRYQWDQTRPVAQVIEGLLNGAVWYRADYANEHTSTRNATTTLWYQHLPGTRSAMNRATSSWTQPAGR